jgi:hypothetical protein
VSTIVGDACVRGNPFLMFSCFLFLQIEEANVFKEAKQFTYKDGVQFVFMDLVWLTVLIIKFVRLQRYFQS